MGAVSGDVTPNSSSPISAWNRKAVPPNLTSTSICKKIKRKKLRECERKKNPKTICCKFAQSVANCKKSPGSHFFSKVHNIWEQAGLLAVDMPYHQKQDPAVFSYHSHADENQRKINFVIAWPYWELSFFKVAKQETPSSVCVIASRLLMWRQQLMKFDEGGIHLTLS